MTEKLMKVLTALLGEIESEKNGREEIVFPPPPPQVEKSSQEKLHSDLEEPIQEIVSQKKKKKRAQDFVRSYEILSPPISMRPPKW